jgi:TPR repeat protein
MNRSKMGEAPIAKWIVVGSLLLALAAALPEVWAGDAENCKTLADGTSAQVAATAVAACRRLADQGNAFAQFDLGNVYNAGRGVPHDFVEAASWYRKAANQGYAKAQYSLGLMYSHGWGVAPDNSEAAKWFRKAADQGDTDAQARIRNMHAKSHDALIVGMDDTGSIGEIIVLSICVAAFLFVAYWLRRWLDGLLLVRRSRSLTPRLGRFWRKRTEDHRDDRDVERGQ